MQAAGGGLNDMVDSGEDGVKLRLTLRIYCDRKPSEALTRLPCRSLNITLAGAVLGAVAFCATGSVPLRAESGAPQPPSAKSVSISGDAKLTRFSLDLDRKIAMRAYTLVNPARVVVDLPQVNFELPSDSSKISRGLIKAFRYGLVMPGGSRVVFDLAGPATIAQATIEEASQGQPDRLVVELRASDEATFAKSTPAAQPRVEVASAEPAPVAATVAAVPAKIVTESSRDTRPVVVIDAGHGGIDNGTQAGGENEKTIVLDFALALRDKIESGGKFRAVMTRADDTFIPLGDRVKIARAHNAQLFVSIHADALPRREGDAQGATIYTLSDRASDAEAERLADSENKSDAIGGVNLTEEPTEVADILIDLAQRETRTFSSRFARILKDEMKSAARMHKNPLKSAGFKVLKAPDIPSVLVELGYVTNKGDLAQMVSQSWRSKTVAAINQAVEGFFAKRMVAVGRDGTAEDRKATAEP